MKTLPLLVRCALCMFVTGLVFPGCDSQDAGDETPPGVPPISAFTLETDFFAPGSGKTEARTHFTAAALRVWPVSVVLGAHLVVPVAVTTAALHDTPSFEDGAWVWSTTTQVEGTPVQFTLTGRPGRSRVEWSMRVTTQEPLLGQTFDDFELYTARTAYDGRSGSWELFYRIDGRRRNVLNAEYQIESASEQTITFSVPETAAEHGGDWVRYRRDGDGRGFRWGQVTAGVDHDVTWNARTHTGSITATNHNAGRPGCWDEELQDATCSD